MYLIIFSLIISILMSLCLGYFLIPLLRKLKFGQNVRDDGPKSHLAKTGTPTMGGFIFIIPLIVTMFLFFGYMSDLGLAALIVTIAYMLIGFGDDLLKVVFKRSLGLKAKYKLLGQISFALLFALYAYLHPDVGSVVIIPFLSIGWDLGIWYVPFVAFVVVATTNSVNLTDGLDGLAASVSFVVIAAFLSLILIFNFDLGFMGMQFADNYQSLAIFSTALSGAILGFLKYNKFPAKVFMGDTGSLALGGAIVAIAVLLRIPLFLPIAGLVFMMETLSVIIQVIYFKITGKRVFKMSPIHHHFELSGMSEKKIVKTFTIITISLCGILILGVLMHLSLF